MPGPLWERVGPVGGDSLLYRPRSDLQVLGEALTAPLPLLLRRRGLAGTSCCCPLRRCVHCSGASRNYVNLLDYWRERVIVPCGEEGSVDVTVPCGRGIVRRVNIISAPGRALCLEVPESSVSVTEVSRGVWIGSSWADMSSGGVLQVLSGLAGGDSSYSVKSIHQGAAPCCHCWCPIGRPPP